MTDINLTLRQARFEDATALIALLNQLGQETEFMSFDRFGMGLNPEILGSHLESLAASSHQLLLVAEMDTELVAVASISGDNDPRVRHIGEVGIGVLQEYWGLGLGSLLMEELLDWAESSEELFRLELKVQVQNIRGRRLYEKFGFELEARMPRGARSDNGNFLEVDLMSLLLH
ncbi:GNAT family N-acetyltransferase [Enterococcus asini]|uniref:GNAT family N-acetyltransferase n=1 Tax=Enterococcus asini TaxID=57732 RepID=UPI00288E9E0E|nr:GNAT family N-acetyltransferase [Enterococcus asini]MDT2756057.1 GNAT family N-acetyltransferase [Enterococcus asini]